MSYSTEGAPGAGPISPAAPLGGPTWAADVYNDLVNLNEALTPEQREAYKQNTLTPGLPPWIFVVLTIITFGLFGTIYHQLKQGKLPVVKPDDPSAGKAIGFMFIPFFNLYWYFVVWPRLVDRINFQYRLRGYPSPINRGQVTTAQIMSLLGWLLIGLVGIAGSIWLLVLGAQIQSASNRLGEENVATRLV